MFDKASKMLDELIIEEKDNCKYLCLQAIIL